MLIAVSVASIIATVVSVNQEKVATRIGKMSNTPEGRLYFACVESILMPVGLFWFGWTSYSSIPWIIPTIAIGCSTIGILSIYLATFNYLADTYHRYASSAIAAQSFCAFICPHSGDKGSTRLQRTTLITLRPQRPWRRVSTGDGCYVYQSWIPRCL